MADDDAILRADDIPWTVTPLPRLELLPAADLLALPPGHLLEYTYDLQRELFAVRHVLHASIYATARVTQQRDRALAQLRPRRSDETRPPA
jgi:hypothetical protein